MQMTELKVIGRARKGGREGVWARPIRTTCSFEPARYNRRACIYRFPSRSFNRGCRATLTAPISRDYKCRISTNRALYGSGKAIRGKPHATAEPSEIPRNSLREAERARSRTFHSRSPPAIPIKIFMRGIYF